MKFFFWDGDPIVQFGSCENLDGELNIIIKIVSFELVDDLWYGFYKNYFNFCLFNFCLLIGSISLGMPIESENILCFS